MIDFISTLRAVAKALLFIFVTAFLLPIQFFYSFFSNNKNQSPVVRLWYHAILRICGIHVKIKNKSLHHKPQTIYLCNHISYVDILVLGAYLDCFFVAKSDVADWPFFGFLSKIGGTIFISRDRKKVKSQVQILACHMMSGKSILIFPEGTTSNGQNVLPFKSSLLNAVTLSGHNPNIQPITLVYTHINNHRMKKQNDFDKVAWYGDMTLTPHLWHFFKQKSVHAHVTLHKTVKMTKETPKLITHDAFKTISDEFLRLIA